MAGTRCGAVEGAIGDKCPQQCERSAFCVPFIEARGNEGKRLLDCIVCTFVRPLAGSHPVTISGELQGRDLVLFHLIYL